MRLRCDYEISTQPSIIIQFIHSSPGWSCLVLWKPIICSQHRGQPAACEGVSVCACPSIIISITLITICFILFQSLTHSDHPSGWSSDRRCSVTYVLAGRRGYERLHSPFHPTLWLTVNYIVGPGWLQAFRTCVMAILMGLGSSPFFPVRSLQYHINPF